MKSLANLIFNILVAEAKAHEGIRKEFVNWFVQTNDGLNHYDNEFRFGGLLGFGGKFWITPARLYVNCYNEDLNAKTKKIISKINKLLIGV